MRLKDKIAIVTGGGSGIGKAISMLFAAEGAVVAIAGRTTSRLEATAGEIKSKGGKALALNTDVSDEKQVLEMVNRTIKEFGHIDILVNDSAYMEMAPFPVIEMPLKHWNNTLNVNLTGTMLCSREVLKYMVPQKSGSIISIASVSGTSGDAAHSAYSASKWGIIGLMASIALETGQYNVRANCISPAATATEGFYEGMHEIARQKAIPYDEFMKMLISNYAMRRLVKPDEIAAAALFLASDDSSAITGQNIIVNCGFHAINPGDVE